MTINIIKLLKVYFRCNIGFANDFCPRPYLKDFIKCFVGILDLKRNADFNIRRRCAKFTFATEEQAEPLIMTNINTLLIEIKCKQRTVLI